MAVLDFFHKKKTVETAEGPPDLALDTDESIPASRIRDEQPTEPFRPAFPNESTQQQPADMQLINTKLDLINQRLENIDRRLQSIEQLAKEEK